MMWVVNEDGDLVNLRYFKRIERSDYNTGGYGIRAYDGVIRELLGAFSTQEEREDAYLNLAATLNAHKLK